MPESFGRVISAWLSLSVSRSSLPIPAPGATARLQYHSVHSRQRGGLVNAAEAVSDAASVL